MGCGMFAKMWDVGLENAVLFTINNLNLYENIYGFD